MKINLSKYAGFCPGVRRADSSLKNVLNNMPKCGRVYTLGQLIHNSIYTDELARLGASVIAFEDVEKIYYSAPECPMSVVIRTHGVTKDKLSFLNEFARIHSNFTIVDATCPFVKRIHEIAEENTNENTCFLLFADPKHPESIGTMSYAVGEKYAF